MHPSSSGVLAELVGEFSGDLTYSELPSISPELAVNVTPLSLLEVILSVEDNPSIGRARFEFVLLLPMADGVAVS